MAVTAAKDSYVSSQFRFVYADPKTLLLTVSKGMCSPTSGGEFHTCLQIGHTVKDGHHTAVVYGGCTGNSEPSDAYIHYCVYVCLT